MTSQNYATHDALETMSYLDQICYVECIGCVKCHWKIFSSKGLEKWNVNKNAALLMKLPFMFWYGNICSLFLGLMCGAWILFKNVQWQMLLKSLKNAFKSTCESNTWMQQICDERYLPKNNLRMYIVHSMFSLYIIISKHSVSFSMSYTLFVLVLSVFDEAYWSDLVTQALLWRHSGYEGVTGDADNGPQSL